MSKIIDPRLNDKYYNFKYININSENVLLYKNPDSTLSSIHSILNTLFSTVSTFNNEQESNVDKLDSLALEIDNNLKKLYEFIIPCASSTDRTKCSKDICKYTSDVENVLNAYIPILNQVTINKKNYEFLPFFLSFSINHIITENPLNGANDKFNLCSGSFYKLPSDNPELRKAYQNIFNKNQKLLQDTNDRTNLNILYSVLGALLGAIVLILLINYIREQYFSNNQEKKEIVKKIGGWLKYFS